jgi:hypothetical protein
VLTGKRGVFSATNSPIHLSPIRGKIRSNGIELNIEN